MVNPIEILKQAQAEKRAIGSFNFSTAEILRAIAEAARETASPVIISTSEGEADFVGWRQATALVESWRQQTGLPFVLNLDHGKSLASVKAAVEAGYNAVHFDGSTLDFAENITRTKEVVDYVRDVDENILVEGELGYLRGSSSLHEEEKLEIREEDLTDPGEAAQFVRETGINSLAMVIGNAHGVYVKSKEKLHLERLKKIKEAVGPETFLVLHGGSGISAADIKQAIALGIVKINVNTDMRLAWAGGLKDKISQDAKETTPYKLLQPGFEAVKGVVSDKIKLFRN